MGLKKHEFILKNMQLCRKLYKSGDLSHKTFQDYRLYKAFISNKGLKNTMEEYRATAYDNNVCTKTVIRAVKNMTQNI